MPLIYGWARGDSYAHTANVHAASVLWTQSLGKTDAVTTKGEKRGTHTGQAWEPNSPPDGSRRLRLDPHTRPQAGRGAGDGEAAATSVCVSGLASGTPSPWLPVAGRRGDVATASPPSCRCSCSPCSGKPAERAGRPPVAQVCSWREGRGLALGCPTAEATPGLHPLPRGLGCPLPEAPATCTSRLRGSRRLWDAESGGRGIRRTGHQDMSSSLESCSGKHHGGAENGQILVQEQTRPSSARAVNPGRQADHLFSLLESPCFG